MESYRESRIEMSRTFSIEPELVVVEGGAPLGTQFKSTIRFDQLDPRFNVIKTRPKLFFHSLLATGILIIVAIAIANFREASLDDFWFLLGVLLPISTLVIALATCRRTEFAQFKNQSGFVILDIAKAGPDKAHFDNFVGLIQEHISQATQTHD